MATGVQPEHISCTSCQRKFRYKVELAGRTVKCPCGSAILVPRPPEPGPAVIGDGDAPQDEYDFAPVPEPKRPAVKRPVPAPIGLDAPDGAADEPDPDFAPAATVSVPAAVRADLPPQRKGLTPEKRLTNEELVPPSTLRDFILPTILIAIGIPLRFYEVMSPAATLAPIPFGEAIGVVATKLALSVGLMLGGMFLAIQIMDIAFIGALPRTAYKLIGIAVGPGALYGILCFAGGEEYGSIIATFGSVAVYAVLFWIIMRLDLKDTAMCVTMTWILVTAANYIGYKVQGLMNDSWV